MRIIHTKETIEKMRQIKLGENNPMYGVNRRGKNNPNYKDGRKSCKTYCQECGKLLTDYRATYCNNCFGLGERSSQWQGGISFEPYPITFNNQLKDKIRVRDNFICQKCGVPELECNSRLSIHHIDYNKKNCEEDNLISLCRKCNSKVNFNREYWTNYFKGGEKI